MGKRFPVFLSMVQQNLPPIPVVSSLENSLPLLGASVRLNNPSPGTCEALSMAKAFAATDDRFGNRILMAFVSSSDKIPAGTAALVTADEIQYDSSQRLISLSLLSVGRARLRRVRNIKNKNLVVADMWTAYWDDVPESSYRMQLQVSLLLLTGGRFS